MFRNTLSLITLLACCITPLQAEELYLAVAANFNRAMNEIVADFEAESGHTVHVSYGASGRLYAQIINGAPFQIFFSADQEKPIALVDSGHGVRESLFTYAIGSLALWSEDENLNLESAQALKDLSVKRLAIANPRFAPYGIAAVQVLEALELLPDYESRLVMGENISQTFQFVQTGNTQAGFVALSQIMQEGEISRGSGWMIPTELYQPIRQDAVLMNKPVIKIAARDFMNFMRSKKAISIMTGYGYLND